MTRTRSSETETPKEKSVRSMSFRPRLTSSSSLSSLYFFPPTASTTLRPFFLPCSTRSNHESITFQQATGYHLPHRSSKRKYRHESLQQSRALQNCSTAGNTHIKHPEAYLLIYCFLSPAVQSSSPS